MKKKKQRVEFVLLWLREDIKPEIKECKSWVNFYIFETTEGKGWAGKTGDAKVFARGPLSSRA